MRSTLDHPSLIDCHDNVSVADGREPVRDDKSRRPARLEYGVDRTLDLALALSVKGAGGFVAD